MMKKKKRTKCKKLFKKLKNSKRKFIVVNHISGHKNIIIDSYPVQIYLFDVTGIEIKRVIAYDTTYYNTLDGVYNDNKINYVASYTNKSKDVIKEIKAHSKEYSNSVIGFKIS